MLDIVVTLVLWLSLGVLSLLTQPRLPKSRWHGCLWVIVGPIGGLAGAFYHRVIVPAVLTKEELARRQSQALAEEEGAAITLAAQVFDCSTEVAEQRLISVRRSFRVLKNQFGREAAARWFTEPLPSLGDRDPFRAIMEGNLNLVYEEMLELLSDPDPD